MLDHHHGNRCRLGNQYRTSRTGQVARYLDGFSRIKVLIRDPFLGVTSRGSQRAAQEAAAGDPVLMGLMSGSDGKFKPEHGSGSEGSDRWPGSGTAATGFTDLLITMVTAG